MNNYDLLYFLHGLIILMVGLIGGYFFAHAIKKKDGGEVAWRVVHSGGCAAGVLLIALGGVINRLAILDLMNSFILWGVVSSTYLLIIGMVIAAISGERGIGNSEGKKSSLWKIVYYLYGVGALVSILSIGTLIVVCLNQIVVA